MIGLTVTITNVPVFFPYVKTTSITPFVWAEILIIVFASTFWIETKKLFGGIAGRPN